MRRIVRRFLPNTGEFEIIDFMDIKAGDTIVLTEYIVPDESAEKLVFAGKVSSDAYFNEINIGTFEYKDN